MNRSLLASSILALAATLPSLAQANGGTITINGEITSQTCKIENGNGDITVTLPKIAAGRMQGVQTAGATRFVIRLTECEAPTGGVRAFFEHGTGVTSDGRLSNVAAVNSAAGVDVELFNIENNNQINIGTSEEAQNTNFVEIASGAATLTYGARYYRTAATVTAGLVRAQAVYSLNYR
ncbi:hypothetical protein CEY09_03920 [Achromobacter marplatensis]|uniref:Major type 1 subunit fimbrin (Pilin) n=1 Tax=Achromobacter marplatensis TaxID=470868 RepID=A0ABX9GE04_9BURK|nr:fimbrial protein [Achromobacter marplatensis]OWT70734.1 hypothetical protein CEY09_03920 [Achromobacter marplatensis]RBP22333.1 major type 1 subunit fimbrin (pilin) [Achromobacter marplatensis]CAB3657446.1 hypothetical protein LMG26219_03108 [Achromobacter marplatensis]